DALELRERRLDLTPVGDVAAVGLEPGDSDGRGRDLVFTDRERRDAGALGEEAAARRLADPARAAGDDDALALEPLHAATLLTLTIGIEPDSSTNDGYAHRVFPVTKGGSADRSPSGEENRVKKWGALAVAVLGAAVMLVSSAGAAEQSLAAKLSTRTGANLYLVQHGLNPTGFVIQRGTHNYAGPKCPGAGWNCTTAKRVLQIADHAGQANQADCVCS